MNYLRLNLLVLFLFSAVVFAETKSNSRVLKISSAHTGVAVSHPQDSEWRLQDRVCVMRFNENIGCGTVLKASAKGAIVKLDTPNPDIMVGDSIAPASNLKQEPTEVKSGRYKMTKKVRETSWYDYNFGIGGNASSAFVYPILNLEFAVTKHFSLGISPLILFGSATGVNLTGMGGFLSLNYYPHEMFHGLWFRAAGGAIQFSTSSTAAAAESKIGVMGLGTVGWKFLLSSSINLGLSAGGQYISDPNFTSIILDGVGFQPVFCFDLGISW